MYMLQIQEALQNAGYFPGSLDNIAGPQTLAAIKAFQADHNLEADGMVGPMTHQALFQDTNPVPSQPGQLTPHFNRQEFKCCCERRYCNGFPNEMHPDLLNHLESVRQNLNTPIIVTSGVRCPTRNQEVGGIPNSKHLIGYAVDCYAPGLSIEALVEAAQRENLGVILYQNEGFCHLEI
ncbi:D-Ala-D-Ala carboxypeptidase family metallohydrolase [Acetobacterium sp.]|uniref:D-Ala-D-Ala carboxypeptidase family metallohydrolase n=1 Tax=Acetobacterium sp. TaxID=1872094 RepID=UPI002F42DBAA